MAKREDIINHTDPRRMALQRKPRWLRERLEWFRDMKFGMIIHWGPYSQWDCLESWGLVPEDTWARRDDMDCWTERAPDLERFQKDYWALNRTFNPTAFDPAGWALAARRAGMRYGAFTTKHHDGFCMWDTRTTDYRVTHPDCPFSQDERADIVRHVFDALRNEGLAVTAYFSKSDWHCPWYWAPAFEVTDRNPNYDTSRHPQIWSRFVQFVHAQVRELMSDYGHVDVLWLDGGQVRPPRQDIDMPRLAAMARELQPGLLIADRTVGGDYEDFVTPEQEVPEEPMGYPWEACLTLGSSWKYRPGKMDYKPAGDVIRMLVDIIAKGGNLLLGLAPTPEGTFDEPTTQRLAEIGRWMDIHGEAVYGTRPLPPYAEGELRFVSKDDTAYAFVFPDNAGELPRTVRLPMQLQPGAAIRLLGSDAPISGRAGEGVTTVPLPTELPSTQCIALAFALPRT